jgi:hypothetical protein
LELLFEALSSGPRPRHYENAARPLVEPVHDPGPHVTGRDVLDRSRAEEPESEEPVHQGPAFMPTRRMHDDPRGLVHDHDGVVDVKYLERDTRVGLGERSRRWRRNDHDDVPLTHLVRSLGLPSPQRDPSVLDPALQLGAGNSLALPAERGGDEAVEPRPRIWPPNEESS